MIYTFSCVNQPGRDMKKISPPLYHVHFTLIHTNSRHNTTYIANNTGIISSLILYSMSMENILLEIQRYTFVPI